MTRLAREPVIVATDFQPTSLPMQFDSISGFRSICAWSLICWQLVDHRL